jgi:hypothetical protein
MFEMKLTICLESRRHKDNYRYNANAGTSLKKGPYAMKFSPGAIYVKNLAFINENTGQTPAR